MAEYQIIIRETENNGVEIVTPKVDLGKESSTAELAAIVMSLNANEIGGYAKNPQQFREMFFEELRQKLFFES